MFKSVPIRLNIVANILFIAFITMLIVFTVQFYYSNKMVYSATEKLFNTISSGIKTRIIEFDNSTSSLIYYIEKHENIHEQPVLGHRCPAEGLITEIMNQNRSIHGVYIGYANGSFYQIVNLNIDKNVRKAYKAPKEASWVVVKILSNTNLKHSYYLDKHNNIIDYKTETTEYTPTDRPWFENALLYPDTIIRTEPYTFFTLQAKGITYAKKMENPKNIVIGIDVSLETISTILDSEKVYSQTRIVIVDSDNKILASTHDLGSTLSNSLVDAKLPDNQLISLNFDNENYLIRSFPIGSGFFENEKIILAIPKSIMVDPYYGIMKISFYSTIALSFLLLPLVVFSSSMMEKPLKKLLRENEFVSQRRFSEVNPVKTYIKEYQELSSSIVRMSSDIESFQLSQQHLFDSFVRLIAQAIDDKSAYAGGHCERVPVICEMLAMAASDSDDDELTNFKITNLDQWREIQLSAWLHDCGKLVIPEFVVDKATRLETIYNRIHEIRTRFEVVWRDYELEAYKKIEEGMDSDIARSWLTDKHQELIDDFNFIAEKNDGENFVSENDIKRIKQIASREWVGHFDTTIGLSYEESQRLEHTDSNIEKLLDDKSEHIIHRSQKQKEFFKNNDLNMTVPENLYNHGEIYNLSTSSGTLNAEERFKINEHIIMTIKMMEQVPFPEQLANVQEFACAHHETMDGKGYPRGLTKEEMSVPARIMAVADIFEALTATDRPYKKAKTLSETLSIMSIMAKDKRIDENIFRLFVKSEIYKEYAKEYLSAEQIDEVDKSLYL